MNPSKKIESVQALRALAAILVMLYHGTLILESIGYSFFFNIFKVGFIGVDIFFVISGFIILNIYFPKQNQISTDQIKIFFYKRFVRIFPIYWIVLIILTIKNMFFTFHRNIDIDFFIFIKSFFLIPIPVSFTIVGISWTLSYELFFYILFGFIFFITPKKIIPIFTLLLIFHFLIFQQFGFSGNSHLLKFLRDPIIIEFLLGCIIAKIAFNYDSFPRLALTGGLLILSISSYFYYRDNTEYFIRAIQYGLPSAIILYGMIKCKIKYPKILIKIGDASYSLYLIHGSVMSIILILSKKLGIQSLFTNFLGACLLFALTIFGSYIFYTLIELPLIEFFKRTEKLVFSKRNQPKPV